MKLLMVTLLLGALLALSHASCYFKRPSQSATHCQDEVDKTWHPIGSTWRNSKCYDCDCTECCTAYSIPRNIPSDCVSVFNPDRCEYIVYRRDDPSVLCPIHSAVGK